MDGEKGRGAKTPAAGRQPESQPDLSPSVEEVDVAIVGMGPAGLYAAWRLTGAERGQDVFGVPAGSLKVGVYDTMDEERVGGRLCTQPLPGFPFLAELGGMRFRENQRLVMGTVKALDLKVKEFNFRQHFYYLRGKTLGENDLRGCGGLACPYELRDDERGRLPPELIEHAIRETLESVQPNSDWFWSSEADGWGIKFESIQKKLKGGKQPLTKREWAIVKRFGSYRSARNLSEVGFWDLLQFQLSAEAWHLAHDGLGYESIMGNWNAAVALPWFLEDFGPGRTLTLEDGMASIPRALYEQLREKTAHPPRHGWELTGLDLHKDAGTSRQRVRLQFTTRDKPGARTVLAKSVVLALPKGALIRLDYGKRLLAKACPPEPGLDKRSWFFDLLHSVDGRPLFKLFLGYSEPWWKEKTGAVTGKVNTDLPLRQIYYYGEDQWNERRAQALGLTSGADRHSMLMASYSDSHYIEFWSERDKPKGHAYCGLEGGKQSLSDEDRDVLEKFGAPRSMIIRAEHQLGLLHGQHVEDEESSTTPRAKLGLYMEWSRPPYYAGWHSWKVGVEPWKVCREIMQPFRDVPVFICGEAYSDEQGWVEGALKSAERLLTLKFKLPLPRPLGDHFNNCRRDLLDYIDAVDEED